MSNILEIILSGDTRQLDAALSKTQKKLKDFGNSTKAIGKSMSVYVTAPITLAGGAAIKFASDFEESLNKVDVAFKNSSNEVRAFAKTALTNFGIAEGTALDMAALFGDMSTSMGLSTQEAANLSTSLVSLAGDLSSFKNMNIEEVTTALNGVFTGETESLKRLGIVMTEVNLQQFALEKGIRKNIKNFTQAEKVQLRYNYVMSKTVNAQGDFVRTSGGAANQMRIFQESLKELGVQFGQVILPTFTKVVKKFNELLKEFRDLSPITKRFIVIMAGIAAAIGPALVAIGSMSTGIGILTASISALNLAAGGIAIAAAAFVYAADQIAPSLSTWEQLKTAISGIAAPMSIAGRLAMAEAKKINKAASVAATGVGVGPAAGPQQQGQSRDFVGASMGFLAGPKQDEVLKPLDLTPTIDKIDTNALGVKIGNVYDYASNILTTKQANFTNEFISGIERAQMFNEQFAEVIKAGLGNLAMGIGEALGQAISSGQSLTQALGTVLLSSMGDIAIQLGQIAIQTGIALMAIKKAFESLGGPIAIAAGIALVALGTAVKGSISNLGGSMGGGGATAFAKGGIVSGPVNALVGEYPGAKSNPEVIAPLNKLKNIIGDQNGSSNVNVNGEFVVRGQDLVVALQRADKTRSRIK